MKEKFNNGAPLLLAKGYATLPTEDQAAIFGTLCMHLALASNSARAGDYTAAAHHLIQGHAEEINVECPMFLELFLAVGKYIDGLENGSIALDAPEEST